MSDVARILTLLDGETLPVPDRLDHALGDWFEDREQRRGSLMRVADALLIRLRAHGLAVVPLAFEKSAQMVDLNIYTQALAWKAEAERRAKTAEDEHEALQRLFVDPPVMEAV